MSKYPRCVPGIVLSVLTALSGSLGASPQKVAAAPPAPGLEQKLWHIYIDDRQPFTAFDGTQGVINLIVDTYCRSRDGYGLYKGTSTLTSVGAKPGIGASLALSAKNIEIKIGAEGPLAPLKLPSEPDPASSGEIEYPGLPDPLAPLEIPDKVLDFQAQGQIAYTWEKMATSLSLKAENKNRASTKAATTFTFGYTLKPAPPSKDFPAPNLVLMTITIAGGQQLSFRGHIGFRKSDPKPKK